VSVFLYDGDCGFCTRCATFLHRHVDTPAKIVAWRSVDLAPLGVTAQECASAVQFSSGGRVSAGPVAIADLLRTAANPGWRVAGRLLGLRPVLVLAWPVYRLVARYRHRLPGGTASCDINLARSS
jgi:predicted DCC family thiol-disulfide oxidoreductase YuxK